MRFAVFLGEIARPFAILSTSASAAFATSVIAWRIDDFGEAAFYIAAVYGGLGALYWGKAWEITKVEKRQPPAPGTAQIIATSDVSVDAEVRDTSTPEDAPWASSKSR